MKKTRIQTEIKAAVIALCERHRGHHRPDSKCQPKDTVMSGRKYFWQIRNHRRNETGWEKAVDRIEMIDRVSCLKSCSRGKKTWEWDSLFISLWLRDKKKERENSIRNSIAFLPYTPSLPLYILFFFLYRQLYECLTRLEDKNSIWRRRAVHILLLFKRKTNDRLHLQVFFPFPFPVLLHPLWLRGTHFNTLSPFTSSPHFMYEILHYSTQHFPVFDCFPRTSSSLTHIFIEIQAEKRISRYKQRRVSKKWLTSYIKVFLVCFLHSIDSQEEPRHVTVIKKSMADFICVCLCFFGLRWRKWRDTCDDTKSLGSW